MLLVGDEEVLSILLLFADLGDVVLFVIFVEEASVLAVDYGLGDYPLGLAALEVAEGVASSAEVVGLVSLV